MSNRIQTSVGNIVSTNVNNVGKDYSHQTICYLDTSSLTRNIISEYQYINLTEAPVRARRLVEQGDILYSTVRPNLRHYGFIGYPPVNNLVVSTGFTVIHPDPNAITPQYLYYWLTQDSVVDRLNSIAELAVTAYPSITPSDIESLKIDYPADIGEQKRIVRALACLDSKIEINRRLNDNLEAMAQALYDYWFVQFDFPDENGKPYKSSGGKMVRNEQLKREIPEGWCVISIADILSPQKAPFKLDAKQYEPSGKYPIFDQATDNYIAGYTNSDDAKQNPHPAVIFGDHTCSVKLASSPFARGADGTQVMTTSHPNLPIYYFYRYIKSTKVPNPGYARHFKFLKTALIILPDKGTVDAFNSCASSIEQKIWSLHREKQHLSLQRNFLLPLLMSGQVQVKPQGKLNYHLTAD